MFSKTPIESTTAYNRASQRSSSQPQYTGVSQKGIYLALSLSELDAQLSAAMQEPLKRDDSAEVNVDYLVCVRNCWSNPCVGSLWNSLREISGQNSWNTPPIAPSAVTIIPLLSVCSQPDRSESG